MVNNQITCKKQENIPSFNNFKHYRSDTKICWGAVWFCSGFFEKQREHNKEQQKKKCSFGQDLG